jgi:DMSO reductase anchor subunit
VVLGSGQQLVSPMLLPLLPLLLLLLLLVGMVRPTAPQASRSLDVPLQQHWPQQQQAQCSITHPLLLLLPIVAGRSLLEARQPLLVMVCALAACLLVMLQTRLIGRSLYLQHQSIVHQRGSRQRGWGC